jgi:ribonuclease-3
MPSDPGEPPPLPPPPRAAEEGEVAALEARLGVRLPDAVLALAALTHKSFVNEHRGEVLSDNERLEFLGDAVIDLAVSHRLMERFPGAREGDLSKIRAAVVDEAGLARIARELDLGPLLRLGRGEELTGGREKSSLLADAMEAVIAAVYLTHGLGAVLGIVDRFLGEAFARAAAGTLDRDYKTQLQELAQSRMRATPRYRVVGERGPDHSKIFDVELELRGAVVGRGEGRSKKDAEQAAAKLALDAMNGGAAGAETATGSKSATGVRNGAGTETETGTETWAATETATEIATGIATEIAIGTEMTAIGTEMTATGTEMTATGTEAGMTEDEAGTGLAATNAGTEGVGGPAGTGRDVAPAAEAPDAVAPFTEGDEPPATPHAAKRREKVGPRAAAGAKPKNKPAVAKPRARAAAARKPARRARKK